MDTINGIKINNTVLSNNNIFKFVTVIDFYCSEDIMFLPLRITKNNEEELSRRFNYLKSQEDSTSNFISYMYEQILEQMPTKTKPNIWNNKIELIVWVKLNIKGLFPKQQLDLTNTYTNLRIINEEKLNFLINALYFYDNFGVEDLSNNYHFVDDLALKGAGIDLPFGSVVHKHYLYFSKPFGNERFYSVEFAQNGGKHFSQQLRTKPIVHTFFPAKLNLEGKSIVEKAKIDVMRLYVYDTSSSSLSATENYAQNNINLSYLPTVNNYDYGAVHYFQPDINYATNLKDYVTSSGKSISSEIKGDIVTKREVIKNKLKLFNSQELTLRIAGAVSLSGRLQWLAKGYKYSDDKRYSSVNYDGVKEKLNYDENFYKNLNESQSFLRISNINFDLFKSAMPVQIHTPPAKSRSLGHSYRSGFPAGYDFAPPIYFRIKDSHTLDVVFEGIDSSLFRQPYSLTTSASHMFFIDVSNIDGILNNHKDTFLDSLPLHLRTS